MELNQHDTMTINCNGKLLDLSCPQVMGILNITPDSFYSGSRKQTECDIEQRALDILREGASIIDIGAYSSRPGATDISSEEEMSRLRKGLAVVRIVLSAYSLLILFVQTLQKCVLRNMVLTL